MGRSTTSPSGSTSPRPTSTAWPRSTPCSRPSSGRRTRSTCASTSSAAPPAGRRSDDLPAGAIASPCLGVCERAPAALVIDAGDARPRRRRHVAAGRRPATASLRAARPDRRPAGTLDAYRAAGGYEALRRAFAIGPAAVIRSASRDAGLVGRGGAAFPTGRKWDAVARQPARPHHLVCNADESEPGTFKDRVLMEGDPFAVIESMTIAAYRHRLRARVDLPARRVPAGAGARSTRRSREARRRGFLGADVLGSGIRLRRHHRPRRRRLHLR